MRAAVRILAPWAALLALCGPGQADELSDARRARSLADELMSPFCPGRTLSDCPGPNAAAVREEIRTWVAQGRSNGEIRAQLEERYGDQLAGEPQSAWGRALPLGAVVLLALAFGVGLRRVIAREGEPPS
jgi:cytochrome c-type biogenesis protein CcmH/NrfF